VVRLVAGELPATAALVEQFRGGVRGEEATGYLAALEGRLALMQGRVRTALDRLREARHHLGLTMARARSSWVDALIEEANAYLQIDAEPIVEDDLDPGGDLAHRFLVVDGFRARAVAKARWGDLPRARALVGQGLQMSEDAGMLATDIWLTYEGFRMGSAEFADLLIAKAGRVAGPAGELFPRHAAAHHANDPNELEAAALALAEAGFDLYASDCAADASRSFRARGLSSGATRCSALAHQLHERCEGARPTTLGELSELASLTPREKDVTLLAAKGLTNREIAEVTCTSLRTVEGHLLRAYRKLGISSRSELASHFGER
jgi:DNA-binding CsgD family transcriptional regulator